MLYKKVPLIEDKISALAIGCWNFGGDWDCSDDENTKEIVHAAIANGINFFDVAPIYGWYHSEEVLGKILQEGGLRNKVIIASKAGLLWDENHKARNNLTRKSLLEEIDGSLKRLRTDHIDIYQMHWPDHNTPIEETAQALADAGVWQAFSFGPALVQDSAVTVSEGEEVGHAMASNPRTAIGIIDDLHYVLVVSDGRTDESAGLTLRQLASFMQGLGVTTAYNLDGGGSSTMYWNGQVINEPTTSGRSIKERSVSDIVYIGS